MSDKAAFKIGEVEYAFPTRFRMIDPVLVEEVTGLEFADFAERIDRAQDGGSSGDAVVLAGMVAVAVWQANPRWKRDRVLAFMNEVDLESFSAAESDVGPPVEETTDGNHSAESSDASISTPVISVVEELV